MAWRPAELLRRQPGFWAALAAVLADPEPSHNPEQTPGAPQRSSPGAPRAIGDAGLEADPGDTLQGQPAEAWRLAGEAYTLQALALDAFASAPSRPPASSSASSAPQRSVSWAPQVGSEGGGGGADAGSGQANSVWQARPGHIHAHPHDSCISTKRNLLGCMIICNDSGFGLCWCRAVVCCTFCKGALRNPTSRFLCLFSQSDPKPAGL